MKKHKTPRPKWSEAPQGATHFNPSGLGSYERIEMHEGYGILHTWVADSAQYRECGALDMNSINMRIARKS